MKKFGTWLARSFLRKTHTNLWVVCVIILISSAPYIGTWWAFLAMFVLAVPASALEAWWNDYADDCSDLEEE
jgi:4-hydroxybenzoate polyprenyltransferase